MTCRIDGCNKPHKALGLCWMHYQRQRRYGTLEAVRRGRHNAEKTHCKHGHPFTEDNIYRRKSNGARMCRECRRIYQREIRQRERQAERESWLALND
jgi:predicted transposase YbfD/YdcC